MAFYKVVSQNVGLKSLKSWQRAILTAATENYSNLIYFG